MIDNNLQEDIRILITNLCVDILLKNGIEPTAVPFQAIYVLNKAMLVIILSLQQALSNETINKLKEQLCKMIMAPEDNIYNTDQKGFH